MWSFSFQLIISVVFASEVERAELSSAFYPASGHIPEIGSDWELSDFSGGVQIPACIDPDGSHGSYEGGIAGEEDSPPSGVPDCSKGVEFECIWRNPQFPAYHPYECKITMPMWMCIEWGAPDGSVKTPEEWWEYWDNRDAETGNECIYNCFGRHESCHAKDFEENPEIRSCETEQNCFQDTIKCLNDCKSEFCKLFGGSNCSNIKKAIKQAKRAKNFNACVCNLESQPITPNHPGCHTCVQQCRNQGGSEAECNILRNIYCKDFQNPNECDEPTDPDVQPDVEPIGGDEKYLWHRAGP